MGKNFNRNFYYIWKKNKLIKVPCKQAPTCSKKKSNLNKRSCLLLITRVNQIKSTILNIKLTILNFQYNVTLYTIRIKKHGNKLFKN